MYSVRQVADYLDLHIGTIYRKISEGKLMAVRLGVDGSYRITHDDLERFIGREIKPLNDA